MKSNLTTTYLGFIFFACVLSANESHAQTPGYNFQPVSLAGAYDTVLWDINNSGVAVGFTTTDPNTNSSLTQGIVYAFGTLTAFTGPPGAVSSDLRGVTNDGTIYGNYSDTFTDSGTGLTAGQSRVFSYRDGSFVTYALDGLASPFVSGVSPNGRWIVGEDSATLQGFVFDRFSGVTTVLRHNDARHVHAAGANDAGQIVGYDRTPTLSGGGFTGSAWIYDIASRTFEDVSIPGKARSAATDINNHSIVSGYYADARFETSVGFTGLGAEVRFIIGDGAPITAVRGANDAGVLVGYYGASADGPFRGFVASPVPEPATVAMLLLGLMAFVAMPSQRGSQRRTRTRPAKPRVVLAIGFKPNWANH